MNKVFFTLTVLSVSVCLSAQTVVTTFAKYGYKKKIQYTMSKGEFDEYHDQADIVEIGSVLFNTQTNEIVGFIEQEDSVNISSVTPAMTIDPLCEKYYWISPYSFCLNNPVRFTDPTGKWVAGTDGKPVTYNNGQWSSNASADVQKVGNAMLGTSTGTERLNNMMGHNEKISISISNETIRTAEGGYMVGNDNRIGMKQSSDGSITVGEHKITIYTGSIEENISGNAGNNPYKG